MSDIFEDRDDIETAIVMALHMDKKAFGKKRTISTRKGGYNIQEMGMDEFCPPEPVFPKSPITFDVNADRVYSATMETILVNPIAAIGHRLEIMLLCDNSVLKWMCFKPMPRPKGIVALTNESHYWFSAHYRTFSFGTNQEYIRRPVAITSSGEVCAIKSLAGVADFPIRRDQEVVSKQLALCLTMFEDAHRKGAFLACVEEHIKLLFPIGEESYKSYLSMRDGHKNTPTQRKNPILHWCSEHFRRGKQKQILVEEHLRGAEEFVVGPMKLTISASKGYDDFLRPSP